MVVRDVGADVLGVVEADDRTTLQRFSDRLLADVGGTPYEQVMLVDGNDDRGIDVGVMVRAPLTIAHLRTHVFDRDAEGVVFSRDCCEYHVRTPDGGVLAVLVNHFKSKGYSEPGDRLGAGRRRRQAARVAEIYRGLRAEGIDRVAIVGDLNDSMDSAPSPRCSPTPTCATSASTPTSTSARVAARSRAATRPASSTTCCCRRRCSRGRPAAPCSAAACGTGRARRTRGRCTTR